jgi:hypothetical protein
MQLVVSGELQEVDELLKLLLALGSIDNLKVVRRIVSLDIALNSWLNHIGIEHSLT